MGVDQTFDEIIAFVLDCTRERTNNVFKVLHGMVLEANVFLCRNYVNLGSNEEAQSAMGPRNSVEEITILLLQTVRQWEHH